jgi:transitional endoplasmic reticulum ATPase/AAA family ATPase
MDHVKLILKESIELPLTHPHLFEMMRVAPPRGILLYGPPGCSKTLMARAIATSGNMNFLAVKGPELLSKWLGESERALASLFRRARLASPSVIFFDEIDAIAEKRGSGGGSGGDRLLSQLLTELDGVSSGGHSSRVVIVGATNRPDILDPALTRPGRMDRKIYVGLPDAEGRESIFRIGLKGKRCDENVDLSTLASNSISHGYTGAEIIAICRDAALLAIGEIDDGKMELPQIKMHHLLESMKNLKPRTTSEMLNFYDNYGRM